MTTIRTRITQWLRSLLYLVTAFPILSALAAITIFGLSSGAILPLAVLIFLALLTAMEFVARFEVQRANTILKTDFAVVSNWFGNPFFSWAGVKERITSLRSWMAVAYIFIAFFWSVVAFLNGAIALIAIAIFIASLGFISIPNVGDGFLYVGDGDLIKGNFSIFDSQIVRFTFDNGRNTASADWNFTWWPTTVISLVIAILCTLTITRNARVIARLVEGLLSGSHLPKIEAEIKARFSKKKVSEREVREAMESEKLQAELSDLSRREREILALMAQGKSNAGIAKALYITEGSVEKHISNILSKLNLPQEAENHRRVLAVLTYLGINPKEQ